MHRPHKSCGPSGNGGPPVHRGSVGGMSSAPHWSQPRGRYGGVVPHHAYTRRKRRLSVTPYFSQKNKTQEIIYLNKENYVHCIHVAAYFIVLISALVFYFVIGNRSRFKSGLNSKWFAN
jgi:hypothetical protein